MVVTFRTDNYPEIMLFGDDAIRLLRMMGHSGTVPGALMAADVPKALARLQAAIAEQEDSDTDEVADAHGPGDDDDEAREPPVSLTHRAITLIELLEAAAKGDCNVMWDSR